MKKTLIYALFALASIGAQAQSLKPVSPSVECGQLLFRSPATITLELKNLSASPVEIKSIDTGCGCVKAMYTNGSIAPNGTAQVQLTLDCKQLGHFERIVQIFDSSSSQPAEISVSGQVVAKIENYSGEYPNQMGSLLTDVNDLEFDDVNQGQHCTQEIHIMNPTGQNVQPTALRLPPYLTVTMKPEVLGPKQKGTMYVSLNSQKLHDYGLTQSSFYLGKNSADKVSSVKEIGVSAVLLPEAIAKDDVTRPYAAKLSMSSKEIDMTELQQKSKAKAEITITNEGKSDLKITKLQLFTTGIEVQLANSTIAPGQSTKLKVSAKAKDMKKIRKRPRILMITNDPDQQKVIIPIKK